MNNGYETVGFLLNPEANRMIRMMSIALLAATLVVFPFSGADAGTLVTATFSPSNLISIQPASGAGTSGALISGATGVPGAAFISALTYDRSSGTLFGIDGVDTDSGEADSGDHLIAINPTTGAGEVRGPVSFSSVASLAFDPVRNKLIGIDRQSQVFMTIDPVSGLSTPIGSVGFDVIGMDFDPISGKLFGAALIQNGSVVDELISIDPLTGAGTAIGPFGFQSVVGLTFDPNAGTLFGITAISHQLISINTSTGTGTAIGPIGFSNIQGLAFLVPETASPVLIFTAALLLALPRENRRGYHRSLAQ
jgi:hypothetical protein